MFNFIFPWSVNPSYVAYVCCNPAFLAAKSNKDYIIIFRIITCD